MQRAASFVVGDVTREVVGKNDGVCETTFVGPDTMGGILSFFNMAKHRGQRSVFGVALLLKYSTVGR